MQEVVKAVIYKDARYLLQLRDNNPSIPYPNTWAFFGGGVEEGEDYKEALSRELKEELQWYPKECTFLSKFKNNEVKCMITHYYVHCDVPDSQLCLGEGQDMKWFTADEILDLGNTAKEVKETIKRAELFREIQ